MNGLDAVGELALLHGIDVARDLCEVKEHLSVPIARYAELELRFGMSLLRS